jgi:hypothetical protein
VSHRRPQAYLYGALVSAAAALPYDHPVRELVATGIRRGYCAEQLLLGYPQEGYAGLLAGLTDTEAVQRAVVAAGWYPAKD